MVKTDVTEQNQAEAEPKTQKAKGFRVSKVKLFFWTFIVVVVAVSVTKPQLVKQAYVYLQERHAQINEPEAPDAVTVLTQQVAVLQKELAAMQYKLENQEPQTANMIINDASLVEMKDRIAAIEKQNLNVIDSKADVAVVLGLLTRMDTAEAKMNKLAKISDDGALILSATMMVKEAAESERAYAYEAEVLDLLVQNDAKIKQPVADVVKYANSGIKSKASLTAEFDGIYKRLLEQQKEEFAKTWKDRLNNKLNEIIKVKRVNKETPEFEQDKTLEEVKHLTDAGDFAKAVALLDDPKNQNLLADAALKEWLPKAKARVEFETAVSRISAHSLALMKVNYIKQESSND